MSLADRLARLTPEQRAALEAKLAAKQAGGTGRGREAPPGVPRRSDPAAPAPLSPGQERLWFLHQLDPADASYNMFIAERLRGRLSVPALRRSLEAITERHDSLRTRFTDEGGWPTQVVEPDLRPELEMLEAADLDAAMEIVSARATAPFDLREGPLLRTTLIRVGDSADAEDHVLCAALHHIIADGASLKIIHSELAVLYAAALAGEADPLPPLPLTYADYAAWRREQGDRDEHLAYWRDRLAGAPVMDLPADRPRPAVKTSAGHLLSVTVPRALADRVEQLGRDERVTPFMTLLSVYQVLLGAYAGLDDVCVGSAIAGRDRPEFQPLVGYFLNTLVLRGDLSGDPTFRELLGRTRTRTLEAFEHQDIPFEKLMTELAVERDTSRTPLFQAMFVVQDPAAAQTSSMPGITTEPLFPPGWHAKFDLMLDVAPHAEHLLVFVTYNTDLFDRATAERLAGHFQRLLELVADDPDATLSALRRSMLAGERHAPAVEPAAEPERTAVARFSEQARRTPDAVAVRQGEREMSYAQLSERADRLASALRREGARPGSLVAVCARRSPDLVAALLAVARAGAAYLPLDPAYPPERLAYMLKDSGASLLLVEPGVEFPGAAVPVVALDATDDTDAAGELPGAGLDDLAYVIYTSGSTGQPKGVEVEHRALAARTGWMRERYALAPGDHVLQFASVSFDTHAEEVYPCLAAGATLVLPPPETPLQDFLATPEGGALTVIDLPTSYWQELVAAGTPWPAGLRLLILGADALPGPALAAWYAAQGDRVKVLNTYGPTETTIIATTAAMDPGEAARRPAIGHPLPGTRCHVLDERMDPVPTGVHGELFIGGAGLARGYRDRPGLTADRFVPDPYGPPGARLYRTGDMVRMRADGSLEFLGRADDQVKVRGHRIEPAEIETALATHPGVGAAAVVADSGTRLIAYVAGGAAHGELREHLTTALPAHMIPDVFVTLDRLPLTPAGKLDRAALPAPGRTAPELRTAPATPTEETVAAVWAEVLGASGVGALDDFFELGGHSLLGTRAIARLRAATGADIPLRALFTDRTVRRLAATIDRLGEGAGEAEIGPAEGPPGLSFAQERLWFLERFAPGTAAYVTPLVVRLPAHPDQAVLERALNVLVARHQSLRMRFPESGDGTPGLVVLPEDQVPLRTAVADDPGPVVAEELARPFDLEAGPLLRALLVSAGEASVLVLTMHHIVSDGWSTEILAEELGALYEAFLAGEPSPLAAPPLRYTDYAAWQREQATGPALGYWRSQLDALPALTLPTDRPRPARQTYNAGTEGFLLDASLSAAIRQLGQEHGATVFMTVLAAFQTLLARYSGQHDFAVGSPVAGRGRRELEGVVGVFVNTLALRAPLAGDPAFTELLARTRETALDAYTHQDVPFERLVSELDTGRDVSRPPLFQVLFAFQNYASEGGRGFEPYPMDAAATRFDLELYVGETGDALSGRLVFNSDLYEPDTIARMGRHLETLLRAVVDRPGTRLSELPLATADERDLVLHRWNDTATGFPGEATLHGLVEEQAGRSPGDVAVVFGDESLTYSELNDQADRLAEVLRGRGVGPETVVGVRADRSLELPGSLLAVLKAGGAYLPVDPSYPGARQELMLSGVPVVLDGTEASGTAGGKRMAATAGNAAYVIYTSGSTGRPKGVVNTHRGIVNRLTWMQAAYGLTGDDVVLQKTPAGFDVSVWEFFWPLISGARLVLARPGGHRDTAYLRDLIIERGVTTAHFVPSMLAAFLNEEGVGGCRSLRRVVCSGEELTPALAARFAERLPWVELHNLYGPTEAAVDVSAHRCAPGEPVVPIGLPVANTRLHVLDERLQPVPIGVTGELYIGGVQVARGYLARPGLTASRFVADPYGPAGSRLYRTGDLARRRADGELEYLGRSDAQVKIRGHRIELGEIETALAAQPGVRAAAVGVVQDAVGARLVGYVVGGADHGRLRAELPAHLIPTAWVSLDELPLTANGKLDRAALPPPGRARDAGFEEPGTPAERAVARVWESVLDLDRVSALDGFFALGGDSIRSLAVVARLRKEGYDIELQELFVHQTVRELAGALRSRAEPQAPAAGAFSMLSPADRAKFGGGA